MEGFRAEIPRDNSDLSRNARIITKGSPRGTFFTLGICRITKPHKTPAEAHAAAAAWSARAPQPRPSSRRFSQMASSRHMHGWSAVWLVNFGNLA